MAEEMIQNLKLNITDNADAAAQSLEKLASSLTSLRQAASGKNNLAGFAGKLETLSKALNQIDASKADAFKTIADSISKLGEAKTFSKTISNNITALGEALSKFEGSESFVNTVEQLGKAAQSFSGVSISTTISKRLNEIHTELSAVTDDEIARLERLAEALMQISLAGTSLPGRRQLAGILGGIRDDGWDSAVDAGSTDMGASAGGAAAPLTRLQSILAGFKSVGAGAASAFKRVASAIGRLGATATKAGGKGLVGLTKNLAKLPVLLGARFASRIKQVTSGLGNMFAALKRIAMYRLFRSAIKMFTEGLQEGVKHMYAYSRAAGTAFAGSMDKIATAGLYVKNSLGSLAAPIVNALAPAIDFVADKVVDLINLISQLFARLSGADTYSKAKKFASTWEDAAEDASGAARKAVDEIKRYTLGFDELNILGKPDDDSGGGGGGGGGGDDGSEMFEEVEISNEISEFADKLKEAFEAQDWHGLGELIGGKINEMIERIDWYDLGYQAGSLLNAGIETSVSMIDTVNWRDIGHSIAEFINGIVDSVNFKDLGKLVTDPFKIAIQGLVGFIEKLDTKDLGDAITDFFVGAFDNITETLESVDWKDFGDTLWQKIKGLFEGLQFGEIASSFMRALGTALRSVVNLLSGFFGAIWEDIVAWWEENISADSFGEVVANLWNALKDALGNITNWVEENIINPFIGALIGDPDFDFSEFCEGIWNGIKNAWDNVKNKVVEFSAAVINEAKKWWKDVKGWWAKKVGKVKEFTTNVINDAKTWWGNVKTWWSQKVGKVKEFTTALKNEGAKWWEKAQKWWNANIKNKSLKEISTNLANTAANWWGKAKKWWNEAMGDNKLKDVVANIKNKASEWWGNVKGWWNDFTDKKAVGFAAKVLKAVSTWWNNVKDWWDDFTDKKAVAFVAKVVKAAGTWWTDVRTAWNNFTGKTVQFSVGIIDAAKDWWADVKKAWAKVVGTLWTSLSIKFPKVDVDWDWDPILHRIKIPTFKVTWEANGGILNGAQIFGMLGNTLLGGGEAGKEAVLPLERNTGWMDDIAGRVLDTLVKAENIIPAMSYGDYSKSTSEDLRNIDNSIEQQNALLRRQNELLTAILQKDSSVQITANAMASAFSRKNQRDGKTIIPLGT